TLSADTKAAATAELAALAPSATMTWNNATHTLSNINDLNLPIPDCDDDDDVNVPILALIAAHPALFQIDLSEWETPRPVKCKLTRSDVSSLIYIERKSLGGHPVAHDVFSYWFKRINGIVTLTSVYGTYLPAHLSNLKGAMTVCNTLTEAEADATA